MASLYTKNGVPLNVSGDAVCNPQGQNFGYISGDRVYDNSGHYRGTIVDGRLVYRSTESAMMGTTRASRAGMGSASAHMAGSGVWGDEPNIDP